MATGVPLTAATVAEARVWTALLRDLVTRLRGQASAALQVVGVLSVGGDAVVTGTLSVGGTSTLAGLVTATSGVTAGGLVTASSGLDVAGAFHPPTSTGAAQTNRITMSTGVPAAGEGSDGDVHIRAGTAGQGTIYRKEAGAWVNKL